MEPWSPRAGPLPIFLSALVEVPHLFAEGTRREAGLRAAAAAPELGREGWPRPRAAAVVLQVTLNPARTAGRPPPLGRLRSARSGVWACDPRRRGRGVGGGAGAAAVPVWAAPLWLRSHLFLKLSVSVFEISFLESHPNNLERGTGVLRLWLLTRGENKNQTWGCNECGVTREQTGRFSPADRHEFAP